MDNPEKHDKDRIEAQERAERIERGEERVFDALTELPYIMVEREKRILQKYGLRNVRPQDTPEREFQLANLSEEASDLARKLIRAYTKRDFNVGDGERSLYDYVIETPLTEAKRHLWRLQRGLDGPIFGVRDHSQDKPTIDPYVVESRAFLCSTCATELREETERGGAEKGIGNSRATKDLFYERGERPGVGFYLFRWEDSYVTRKGGDLMGEWSFPAVEPHVCERCGVSDVDLWREWAGEEEE